MKTATLSARRPRLVLNAETAEDLMTPDLVSIRQTATIREAAALLTAKEISAAPVIDDAGRPVGVLSRTDIVRYLQEQASADAGSDRSEPPPEGTVEGGLPIEASDLTLVRDIMTPTVLTVRARASVVEVVGMLVGVGRIHRLFVVDDTGVLVGVVTATDVVRKLHSPE